MKKFISLILAALLVLSTLTTAFAATYTDKDTVKKVQQALNDAGYNCGTPDGVAGKKTAAAITQYQTDKGLEATGTIDDALLEAMGLAEAEPVQPTTDQEGVP
jgi:peptidoglycan hydrolase-like protein with peptidoglycan-binding domain